MARKNKELVDTEPDADWATVVGGPNDTPFRPHTTAAAPAKAQRGRGRTGLILLMSFVVQLAVVLAAGSTGVVDRSARYSADHATLLGAFARLPGVFAWRFSPPLSDPTRLYPAQLFGLLALFVVAGLLTLALVRGPVTFWRAFFAVASSVTLATLAAGMVTRGIVNDAGAYSRFGGKAGGVLFASSGYEVIAGAIMGVLAGLVAAIVAVVSRRPVEVVVPVEVAAPEPYVEPAAPPPWHGHEPVRTTDEPARTTPTADAQATTQFEPVRRPTESAADDKTQALPATTASAEAEKSAAPVEARTSSFPRPPDDEALGHHDDHEDHEDHPDQDGR